MRQRNNNKGNNLAERKSDSEERRRDEDRVWVDLRVQGVDVTVYCAVEKDVGRERMSERAS